MEIRCRCAFTYMNAVFRKNLTETLAGDANDEGTVLDTGGAFSGVTGIAPSRRMIATCMWGVSDPLRAGRGAKKAAAKWGSLTPRMHVAFVRQNRALSLPSSSAPPGVRRGVHVIRGDCERVCQVPPENCVHIGERALAPNLA